MCEKDKGPSELAALLNKLHFYQGLCLKAKDELDRQAEELTYQRQERIKAIELISEYDRKWGEDKLQLQAEAKKWEDRWHRLDNTNVEMKLLAEAEKKELQARVNKMYATYKVDEIEKLKEESRWIPVGERLPEIIRDEVGCSSDYVLVVTTNNSWLKAYYDDKEKRWVFFGILFPKRYGPKLKVTHWKPIILPKP